MFKRYFTNKRLYEAPAMYAAHEYDNREIIYISIKQIFYGVVAAGVEIL